MTWRIWMGAAALLVALTACGDGGDSTDDPLTCSDGNLLCGTSCVDQSSDPRHCGGCDNACAAGEVCTEGVCDVACPAGQEACDGSCVDLGNDPMNCGGCGTTCGFGEACIDGACQGSCPRGQEACDGTCVNVATDRQHCGGCGLACGAGEACVDGTCSDVCPEGQTNCNGSCVSLDTTWDHCGACGNACEAGEVCGSGHCMESCPAGQNICDEGCFDLSTSAQHCGTCGMTCAAGEACLDGVCTTSCGEGLTNCGGSCVDNLANRNHCGGCGIACSPDELCTDGVCTLHCAPGTTVCGDVCADTSTDTAHCGACGTACAPGEMCDGGSCVPACNPFASTLCDGVCTNTDFDRENCGGCGLACDAGLVCDEGVCTAYCGDDKATCDGACTSTADDPNNCGACGEVCPVKANAASICAAGNCASLCEPGFGDCNRDLGTSGSDGCETSLLADVANCGGCGNVCPEPNNATAACVDSTCGLGACLPGYFDCDGLPENGCEVELSTSNQHCGACGTACGTGEFCDAGQCAPLPPGDSCTNPIVAGPGKHTVTWHDKGFPEWITSIPSCGSSNPTGGDIVIEYQAVGTGTATITVAKPISQRWHMVVSDQACGTVVEYACMSDFSPAQLELAFPITSGQTYYIYLVDSTSGTAPLDNPLTFEIEELDCNTYSPGVEQLHPANGGVQYVRDAPIAAHFNAPVTFNGTVSLTDSSGNTITLPADDVEHEDSGKTLVVNPDQPLAAGETYTVSWTGVHATICGGNAIAPPAWTFTTPAAPAACVPGTTPGLLNGNVTRIPTTMMGTFTEYYMAADDDPTGWVYVGGTTTLYRINKVTGFAQSVHAAADIGGDQLGYSMAIEGSRIITAESATSGTEEHIWQISTDKGQSWDVKDAAIFPAAPNDDIRAVALRDGRAYAITQEINDGNEIWSVDLTGSLPGEARLEVTFGGGSLNYCTGLDLDDQYFYANCRRDQTPATYYQVRIDRTTGAYAVLTSGFDGNTTSTAMHAVDTNGDGLADFLYFAADDSEGYAICNPTGSNPGSTNLYSFGTGTGNYGLAWDPGLNVLWAYDDDSSNLELIKID